MDKRTKSLLVIFSTVAFTVIAGFLFWFFFLGTKTPVGAGWYAFSFAAGLTMIVLPCTLPLAFVIVPLSMGKGPIKGLSIALAFGFGVAFTLSMYGILAAILGKVAIGSLGAPLELVKNWLYFIAGGLAYIFALGELGFVRFRMPTYGGAAPAIIQKQKDVVKALLLGLFLGNIGVGCPHPATPVLLTRIAVSGDVFYGWLLFFVHAVGRVLPLLLLAVLGILGVNALSWLTSRKDKVEKATGWGMVFVAAFIMVLGLFTHDWWVNSGQHTLLEEVTQEERFLGALIDRLGFSGAPHAHGLEVGAGLFGLPLGFGNVVLVLLWLLPVWWWLKKKQESLSTLPPEEQGVEKKLMPMRVLNIGILSLVVFVTMVFVLPDRFYVRSMMGDHHMEEEASEEHEHAEAEDEHAEGDHMESMEEHMEASGMEGMMAHEGHEAMYHEEESITEGPSVALTVSAQEVSVGQAVDLNFFVNQKPEGTPITNLDVAHEKLMHVIGLREDMNQFFHIHPVQTETPGVFRVSHTFSAPGAYKIWSEVKIDGVSHTIGHKLLTVSGPGETFKKDVAYSRSVIASNYQVQLGYSGTLVKGKDTSLSFEIHDASGKDIDVEPYLGADMHLSIIKDDLKTFLHTHPEEGGHAHSMNMLQVIPVVFADEGHEHTENAPENSEETGHGILFHATFPEAGVYKAYAQFRPKGTTLPQDEAILAEFWLKVEERPPFPIDPWWFLLVTSLIFTGGLSWAVKKYLTVPENFGMKKKTEKIQAPGSASSPTQGSASGSPAHAALADAQSILASKQQTEGTQPAGQNNEAPSVTSGLKQNQEVNT